MQPSNRRRWGGLAVLTLALAIIIIDTTLINVSLRTIVGDLHTTVQNLQWVITGYSLVLSAFTITGGRMGDLFGRKRMFMLGAIVFALGSLVAATTTGYAQLVIGASVIEGLGAAMMMPATASLLLANFQGRERAIAFGVWGGVAGAAAAFGPLVGGYLTSYYSWRYGYGINLVIVAILLAFSWLVVDPKSTHETRKPTIDFVGIFLLAFGLASVVYGIVQSSTDGWIKAKQPAHFFNFTLNLGDYSLVPFMVVLGLILLVMFIMWEYIVEARGKMPLVSLRLLSNGRFVAGISTMAIVAMGQFGVLFALPVFFQGVRGLDAFHTGLAFLPFSLTSLFVAPISGILGSRRIPPKYLIITGLIIDTIGMYYLRSQMNADATPESLRLPLIVFGLGFGMAFSQLNNVTLSAVNVREAGEASGVNNTARQLGATLGNAIIGSVLLAALATNLTSAINDSKVIPIALKDTVTATAKVQAQSLGQGSEGSKPVSGPIKQELTHIREVATAKSIKNALGYGCVILFAGVLVSTRLPRQAGHSTSPAPLNPVVAEKPVAPMSSPTPSSDSFPEPETEPRSPTKDQAKPKRGHKVADSAPAKKPLKL